MLFNLPSLRKQSSNNSNDVSVIDVANSTSDRKDGKIELTEKDAFAALGFSWPTTKKWYIITVIFAIRKSPPPLSTDPGS